MPSYSEGDIARAIDHSVLLPNLTTEEARAAILVGRAASCASCCVRPCDVPMARDLLSGSSTLVCTVIGFPHGSTTTAAKVAEARVALAEGATELDMVLNVSKLRSGDAAYVLADIAAVTAAAREGGGSVKVILENAYLTDAEKVLACQLCEQAGAAFVKTSTGFAPSGATLADLRLMRASVGPQVQVKAAGGIRTLDALLDALRAGATRIGATATTAILAEFRARTEATGGVLVAEGGEGATAGAAAGAPASGAPGTAY